MFRRTLGFWVNGRESRRQGAPRAILEDAPRRVSLSWPGALHATTTVTIEERSPRRTQAAGICTTSPNGARPAGLQVSAPGATREPAVERGKPPRTLGVTVDPLLALNSP